MHPRFTDEETEAKRRPTCRRQKPGEVPVFSHHQEPSCPSRRASGGLEETELEGGGVDPHVTWSKVEHAGGQNMEVPVEPRGLIGVLRNEIYLHTVRAQ